MAPSTAVSSPSRCHLAVCGFIGLVNGLLIARARMAAFIVTLATLLFARGLAFAVSDEGNRIFHIEAGLAVSALGQGSLVGIRLPDRDRRDRVPGSGGSP